MLRQLTHKLVDDLRGELAKQLYVGVESQGIDRVHADHIHLPVGQHPEGVHQRLAELTPGPKQLLPRFERLSAVATPHRDERSAAKGLRDHRQRGEVHERDRRGHLLRERLYPPNVKVQYLCGSLQRVEEVPSEDRSERVESELHRSDYSEVAPTALEAPEEVRVLVGAHPK